MSKSLRELKRRQTLYLHRFAMSPKPVAMAYLDLATKLQSQIVAIERKLKRQQLGILEE